MGFRCYVRVLLAVGCMVWGSLGEPRLETAAYHFSGEVQDIRWLGRDSKTVIFLTSANEAHISSDEGKSFRSLQKDLRELGGARSQDISNIYVSKANKDMVYLQSQGHISYVSVDKGKTWSTTGSLPRTGEVLLHPTDDSLILASSLTERCGSKAIEAEELCYRQLFQSTNRGKTWKLIEKFVVQFDWYCSLQGVDTQQHKHAVLATIYRSHNRFRNQVFGYWHPDVDFVITHNYFRTKKVLVYGGNRFLSSGKFLFAVEINPKADAPFMHVRSSQDKVAVSLRISYDKGKTFTDGHLPFQLSQRSYTILDATEGSVFLHVNHGEPSGGYGHVYISDQEGSNFALSFKDNHRNGEGKADFEKVLSMEGVYVANYVENAADMERASRRDHQDTDLSSKRRHRKHSPKLRTIISFDKGGEWSSLEPPSVDSLGDEIRCSGKCGLHLHGQTSSLAPVYSAKSAVGIMLGTGNVGSHLSASRQDANTFLSKDGGLTWKEIRKGAYIYEVGDHGGLLVMADDLRKTRNLIYTWNEGLDWEQVKISEEFIEVQNIIIEPTSTSNVFLVYGSMPGASDRGVIVYTNFAELHERECKGADKPGTPGSDYEVWTPQAGIGQKGARCLMGHLTQYTRRKSDAACFNPAKLEKKHRKKNCPCTARDYECDFGYMRKFNHGPCERDLEVPESALDVGRHCPKEGLYAVSNGYRLVAGNTCVGGVQLGPTMFPCRNGVLGVSMHGWLVLLLIIGLIIGMSVITYKSSHDPEAEFEKFSTRHFGDGPSPHGEGVKGFVKGLLLSIGALVMRAVGKAKSPAAYRPDYYAPVKEDFVPETIGMTDGYDSQETPAEEEEEEYWGEEAEELEAEPVNLIDTQMTMDPKLTTPMKELPSVPRIAQPPSHGDVV